MPEPFDPQMTPDLDDFERALASVPPTPGHLDPLVASFTAGQRSRQSQLRLWRTATCAALLLAMTPQFIPHYPPPPIPARPTLALTPAAAPTPLSSQSVLMLQHAVLHNGLAGLPPTRLPDSPPPHPPNAL